MKYTTIPCPCGHRSCKDWHVAPVAAVQGVNFTRSQAIAVAVALELHDAIEADRAARRKPRKD